jgi:retinol-binding protein 3
MLFRFSVFFLLLIWRTKAETAVPNTPAGQTLRTWLEAFNSGDRTTVETYVKTVDSSQSVDGMLAFRNQTGGFDLTSIETSEPLHVRFQVKEKNSQTTALGNLIVKEGHPPSVQSFGLRAVPPGVVLENVAVDANLRKRVIEQVNSRLAESYIDSAVAQRMAEALLEHEAAGEYSNIADGDQLAAKLTKDLRAVSHDKHVFVSFSPFKMPDRKEPSTEELTRMRTETKRANCAFKKVEILPGNIGYIKFDAFMSTEDCAPTVVAAMGFVAHADALIFDIRENGGGDPAMVSLLASFLFDKPTHLNDLYNRKDGSTHQFWTVPYLSGDRFPKQPVFVLTSRRTFSGAEEFAYDLQNQKRAMIVGEVTGGGAHPVSGHVVADYFAIGVPFAKAVNPVTKTDWEGTGIQPDVRVPAADALTTAQKLAADQLRATLQAQSR